MGVTAISRKVGLTQASLLDGQFVLDTTGEDINGRISTVRSLSRATRQLFSINSDGATVHLNTSAGESLAAIAALDSGTASVADIITAVQDAVQGDVVFSEPTVTAFVNSRSLKQTIAGSTILLGDGFFAIDTTSEPNTTHFRPATLSSLRANIRRVIGRSGGTSNIFLRTTSGLMVKAIKTATATAEGIILAVQGAFADSTSSTTQNATTAFVSAASEKEIFADLLVTTTPGIVAIDDTNEPDATRTARKASGRQDFLRLIVDSPAGTTNIRLNTTSGAAMRAVANLPVSGTTAADVINAVISAI